MSCSELYSGRVDKWLEIYHSGLDSVIEHISKFQGLKSHIGVSDIDGSLGYIHASMVISDLTTLAVSGQGERKIRICPDLAGAKITVPNKIIAEQGIDINSPWKSVGYMHGSSKHVIKLIRSLRPAIKNGSILIRPDRIAIFKKADGSFHSIGCDPDCSKMDWIVSDQDRVQEILPVKVVSDRNLDLDISVPYLKNISTDKFIKVLDENQDCIKSLRSALRNVVKDAQSLSASELRDIRYDGIDPRLEELERAYKRIVRSSRIKVGSVAIGTVTASLSAIVAGVDGMAINSLLGMGGLGLLGKQYADYREKLDYLRDNSFYLFWKVREDSEVP